MYEEGARKAKSTDERASHLIKPLARVALDQPLVRAISDATDITSPSNTAGSYVGSFIPTFAKDAGEVLDPQARQSYGQGFKAQIRSRIPPGLPFNRTQLPVNPNIDEGERGGVGRRLIRALDPLNTTTEGRGPKAGGLNLSTEAGQELERLNVHVGQAKIGQGEPVKDFTERSQRTASGIRQAVEELIKSDEYRKAENDDERKEMIRSTIMDVRRDNSVE
jgi:hypothetical protein